MNAIKNIKEKIKNEIPIIGTVVGINVVVSLNYYVI